MLRLSVELRYGQKFSERAERIAGRISGGLLFALAAYVTAGAVSELWNGTGEGFSWPGFIVSLVAIPAMAIWRNARSTLLRRSEAARSVPTRWKP
jgi:divalent metal cation (Fe/Co/Zn/Cd) transporter